MQYPRLRSLSVKDLELGSANRLHSYRCSCFDDSKETTPGSFLFAQHPDDAENASSVADAAAGPAAVAEDISAVGIVVAVDNSADAVVAAFHHLDNRCQY